MQLLFYVNQTYIFLCCSTNLTFHVKLLFFTPTYFIHFLSWQSYFTEESLCDWNRYEIKLCFKIFVGAVFLSSSESFSSLTTHIAGFHLEMMLPKIDLWSVVQATCKRFNIIFTNCQSSSLWLFSSMSALLINCLKDPM